MPGFGDSLKWEGSLVACSFFTSINVVLVHFQKVILNEREQAVFLVKYQI